MTVGIVLYFLQVSMYIHSFSSVFAVKLDECAFQIISSLVWKCASVHDGVNVLSLDLVPENPPWYHTGPVCTAYHTAYISSGTYMYMRFDPASWPARGAVLGVVG